MAIERLHTNWYHRSKDPFKLCVSACVQQYSSVHSVPLSSPVSVQTTVTSSLASTASWKAGSGSGDGVLGLSAAGDDLLLLMCARNRERKRGRLQQDVLCRAERTDVMVSASYPLSPPNRLGVVSTLWTFCGGAREHIFFSWWHWTMTDGQKSDVQATQRQVAQGNKRKFLGREVWMWSRLRVL